MFLGADSYIFMDVSVLRFLFAKIRWFAIRFAIGVKNCELEKGSPIPKLDDDYHGNVSTRNVIHFIFVAHTNKGRGNPWKL